MSSIIHTYRHLSIGVCSYFRSFCRNTFVCVFFTFFYDLGLTGFYLVEIAHAYTKDMGGGLYTIHPYISIVSANLYLSLDPFDSFGSDKERIYNLVFGHQKDLGPAIFADV